VPAPLLHHRDGCSFSRSGLQHDEPGEPICDSWSHSTSTKIRKLLAAGARLDRFENVDGASQAQALISAVAANEHIRYDSLIHLINNWLAANAITQLNALVVIFGDVILKRCEWNAALLCKSS
jgi:hypothetical protein